MSNPSNLELHPFMLTFPLQGPPTTTPTVSSVPQWLSPPKGRPLPRTPSQPSLFTRPSSPEVQGRHPGGTITPTITMAARSRRRSSSTTRMSWLEQLRGIRFKRNLRLKRQTTWVSSTTTSRKLPHKGWYLSGLFYVH